MLNKFYIFIWRLNAVKATFLLDFKDEIGFCKLVLFLSLSPPPSLDKIHFKELLTEIIFIIHHKFIINHTIHSVVFYGIPVFVSMGSSWYYLC